MVLVPEQRSQREPENDQHLHREPAYGCAAPTHSPSGHGIEDVAAVGDGEREEVEDEDRVADRGEGSENPGVLDGEVPEADEDHARYERGERSGQSDSAEV